MASDQLTTTSPPADGTWAPLDIEDIIGARDMVIGKRITNSFVKNEVEIKYTRRALSTVGNDEQAWLLSFPIRLRPYDTKRRGRGVTYTCSLYWDDLYDRSVIRTFISLQDILQRELNRDVTIMYKHGDDGYKIFVKDDTSDHIPIGETTLVDVKIPYLSKTSKYIVAFTRL